MSFDVALQTVEQFRSAQKVSCLQSRVDVVRTGWSKVLASHTVRSCKTGDLLTSLSPCSSA